MRYSTPSALIVALALLAPGAGAQNDRPQAPKPFVPVPAAPKPFVPTQGVARPAIPKVSPNATRPSARGGLMGVPAKLPNVLGRNRSLPLERRITLPGLAPDGHPGSGPVVGPIGGPIWDPDCDFDRGGLVVDGRVIDGDWKVGFHLGGPSLIDCDKDDHHHHDHWFHGVPWYYRYGSWYRTGAIDGVYTQPVDYSLRMPQIAQPPAPPAQPERELTAIERAELLMAVEELDGAISAYREHLGADPEDVQAIRALGLAMIEDGRFEDGVAMVALAYRTDPMLARTPLDLAALGLDGKRYNSLLARVLGFAKRTDSGSAHLVGAMLLQADGKLSGAARVLERSEKAGLEDAIADAFRRELGRPANG
ncbi:MAG TPA: hypothetical protein VFF69_05815 [Phycisphaerales bacterium]|nr:hypothetical protein [Phycisphaerales bacterium]